MVDEDQALHIERMRALSRLLISKRREMGLSQREIARRSGLPQSRISRIEAGTHERDIGLRVMPPLSEGYGVPLVELLAIFYPDLSDSETRDDILNIKIEPTKSFERSVMELRATVIASNSKLEATLTQAIENLQTSQEEALAEIRNALLVVMAASNSATSRDDVD